MDGLFINANSHSQLISSVDDTVELTTVHYICIVINTRLTIRNLKCKDKIPDKFAIARTYQTISDNKVIIITVLNTLYVCGNAVCMREHVVLSL